MSKLIAIKNVDKDLYRRVKAIATLQGRTMGSVINEALKLWLQKYSHIIDQKWKSIEKEYERNVKVAKSLKNKQWKGYALICNGEVIGIYSDLKKAMENAKGKCKNHSLIIELSNIVEHEIVELGLPVVL